MNRNTTCDRPNEATRQAESNDDKIWHIIPAGEGDVAYCGYIPSRENKPFNAPWCDVCMALHKASGHRLARKSWHHT